LPLNIEHEPGEHAILAARMVTNGGRRTRLAIEGDKNIMTAR